MNLSSRLKIIVPTVVITSVIFLIVWRVIHPNSPDSFKSPEELRGSAFDCQVLDYGYNPHGDMDKILILRDIDTLWLHFPPHTAAMLLQLATKNAMVRVNAFEGLVTRAPKENMAMYELNSLSNKTMGQTVDIRSIPPPSPSPGEFVQIQGDASSLQVDSGMQIGFFFVTGRLVSLPPRSAAILIPVLRQGHQIVIRGYARSSGDGFVNRTGKPSIRPHDITIDGVNYLTE